jgi:hypothetical protein
VLAALVALAPSARADEQMIIKLAGDHPRYTVEIEPQLLLGWNELSEGPGVGFRAVIPIIDNGFLSRINNSVGIGFGFDANPISGKHFAFPVVLQWNFWLSTHWSVFGEPGLAVVFDHGDGRFGPVVYAGGRYHFTPAIALTLRLGVPALDAAIGVSFLL